MATKELDPHLKILLEKIRGNPFAMVKFARTSLLYRGFANEGRQLCREALELDPDNPELVALTKRLVNDKVPYYYFTMVQDHDRHALYEKAFAATIKPGSLVLDIGAGTGLFAMMAARAGAGKVIACEANPLVAEMTRAVIAKNGLSDKVEVIDKFSRNINLGDDLPERADVLIWDNLANNLIGADGLSSVRDARLRLLKKDAPIIPCRGEIYAALAKNKSKRDQPMGDVEGFDLSPFNELRNLELTVSERDFELRSDAVLMHDISFQEDEPDLSKSCVQPTGGSGEADCIIQWVRFHIAPGIIYNTNAKSVTAFGQRLHNIKPRTLDSSNTPKICSNIDGRWFWMWAEDS